ncbi:MAG: hypothetical protein ACYC5Y_15780, partial [Symbiobacteriia bacterium]
VRGVVTLAPFLLWNAGMLQAWHVYAVFVLNGVLGTPYGPVSGAMLPRLVPEGMLARANSWLVGGTQAMYLIGPMAGGLVIARFGAPQSLLVDAASFWLSSLLIGLLRVPAERAGKVSGVAAAENYWAAIRGG